MNSLLNRYYQEKFFIIPIKPNEKRPVYKKWNQYSLSLLEAEKWLKNGYNLAVVAKDLWILDYDERLLPAGEEYRIWHTLVQFTPHGYHVFYRAKSLDDIVTKMPMRTPDTVRHGDMYALLAPSRVDGKSYWWLDSMKGEILQL